MIYTENVHRKKVVAMFIISVVDLIHSNFSFCCVLEQYIEQHRKNVSI